MKITITLRLSLKFFSSSGPLCLSPALPRHITSVSDLILVIGAVLISMDYQKTSQVPAQLFPLAARFLSRMPPGRTQGDNAQQG